MKYGIFILALLILVIGCGKKPQKTPKDIFNANGIRVYAKTTTDNFPTASLTELTSKEEVKIGKNTFNYKVEAYKLKNQSPSANTNALANSGKGQHIHFILNNGPYQAKYEPNFEVELKEGSHLVLAFLSRSFHESVKNKEGFVLKQYFLNSNDTLANIDKDPLLFYSRPKGTYKMSDAQKILLDFFLVNATLAKNGNKVKVHVNENSFVVDKWQPYIIEGLQKGEHTIQIELIDKNNKPVPGPFNNSGKRKFIII